VAQKRKQHRTLRPQLAQANAGSAGFGQNDSSKFRGQRFSHAEILEAAA
jgi:hypothetical protein